MARAKAPLSTVGSPDEIEAQFYEALRAGNIEQLMDVWADDEDIVCAPPGGRRMVGPAAIREAFEAIFARTHIDVRPERVRRLQWPGCAVHSVLVRVPVMTPQGADQAWVTATNVYAETPRGWRMVAHHAGPGLPDDTGELGEAGAVLH
jgi:ketosteroid isomerase-like protein